MNISSRCEYACRAMLELAQHEASQVTVTAEAIAVQRHIPEKYLVHVLLQLKRSGLVNSVRGAQGGYLLRRPASEITLLDVVTAIDGPLLAPLPVQDEASAHLAPIWREVAAAMAAELSRTTLQDMVERTEDTHMFHI